MDVGEGLEKVGWFSTWQLLRKESRGRREEGRSSSSSPPHPPFQLLRALLLDRYPLFRQLHQTYYASIFPTHGHRTRSKPASRGRRASFVGLLLHHFSFLPFLSSSLVFAFLGVPQKIGLIGHILGLRTDWHVYRHVNSFGPDGRESRVWEGQEARDEDEAQQGESTVLLPSFVDGEKEA